MSDLRVLVCAILLTLSGCATLGDIAEGLSGAGSRISQDARARQPAIDPTGIARIRPF